MTYTTNKFERESKNVKVMDTTLRDGEQNPLCTMFVSDKYNIAKKLEELSVDIIEVGFAASKLHPKTMGAIAGMVKQPYLCGLSRAMEKDVDSTFEVYKNYDKRMIHIFLPTSDIQVNAKLKKSEQELIDISARIVRYASKLFPIVEFTAEDATRSDLEFLRKIYTVAIDNGASVLNVADTVGCADPDYFGDLVRKIKEITYEKNPMTKVSVHCHNDLGLAWANTLAGIKNGADQIECTILGIGERAGNCSLEQAVAYTTIHPKIFRTNVKSEKLYGAALAVKKAISLAGPPVPVVGETSFSHKSGIHQHGQNNNSRAYEALNPTDFGRASEIAIGPSSGYHGVIELAKNNGYEISKEQAATIIDEIAGFVEREEQRIFFNEEVIEMIRRKFS